MSGGPPLFVACETGNLDLLIEALQTASVDTPSPNQSFTPLMVAANRGSIELVNHLIGAGANVNAQSDGGFTALILAIASYNEISAIKKVEHDTSNASIAVIKALIAGGANVNLATEGGNTALQEAALAGCAEIVQLLLAEGALVNALNKWNESALIVGSLKSGVPEVATLLIDAGADMTLQDVDGLTALDMAIKSENELVAAVIKGRLASAAATCG